MVWKPRVTVAAIVERQGRFLMVEERVNGEIRFNQPAGHLEDTESLLDAVVRECLEETAWHFHPQALVGLYRWRQPDSGETYLRATFCGECVEFDSQRTLDEGIIAAHWLTRDEICMCEPQLRSPLVLRCIDDYLLGRQFPLKLLVEMSEV